MLLPDKSQIAIRDRLNRRDQSPRQAAKTIRVADGCHLRERFCPTVSRPYDACDMTMRRAGYLFAAILLAWSVGIVDGQAPANVLVIDGGTLIDGNGGAPIRDVQIVIRGNRIAAIGRRGAATPAGARVIAGEGKFIIPGLWDSQLNFYSHHG